MSDRLSVNAFLFDPWFHATQLIVAGADYQTGRALIEAVRAGELDALSWYVVAVHVTDRWRELTEDEQAEWLAQHEDCDCQTVLQNMLAQVDAGAAEVRKWYREHGDEAS
jgi:hypothetical protein